jgi:hypothetical protein
VDVWELLALPRKSHSFFGVQDFLEIFGERVRNGCARSLAG